jgi:type VI secretion system protein ImpH
VASEERQQGPSVKEDLFKEFYRFSFFKAVQLIEQLNPAKKPLGKALVPRDEPVRFSVKPGFKFPPSDISNLTATDGEEPVAMEVAFMGLIGPAGVMPHWYNELAAERLRQKDSSMTSFFDVFHHRLISLFYLAWKKYRLTGSYLPGARDRISRCLLSYIGLGTPGLTNRIALPEGSLIYYSGHLSKCAASSAAIEATAEYFSRTPARVEQFIDRIVYISPEDQTQLGLANAKLGIDALCGNSAWENQTKFRLNLGPMGYKNFIHFLPDGKRLRLIMALTQYMVGIEYEFEIGLVLKRQEVPLCALGVSTPAPPSLGWSTWIKTPGFIHEEDPCVIMQKPESLQKC